jgi:hypothetical protein
MVMATTNLVGKIGEIGVESPSGPKHQPTHGSTTWRARTGEEVLP